MSERREYRDERPTDLYPVMTPSYQRCPRCRGERFIGAYYSFHTCPTCGGVGIVLVAPTRGQEDRTT